MLRTSAALALAVALVPLAARAADAPRVTFAHAFGPPHRVTAGMPDASQRTLLDLTPGALRLAWSYDDLTTYPLGAFKTPPTAWNVTVTPTVDGRAPAAARWSRVDGGLPSADVVYDDPAVSLRLQALGGPTATVVRIDLAVKDNKPHQVLLRCESGSWGENRAWVEPGHSPGDHLLAGWNERADRVLVLGLGAGRASVRPDGRPPGPRTLLLGWDLGPGETKTGWLVRPYRAFAADLDRLRKHDWAGEMEAGRKTWAALLDRAARLTVPDPGVAAAYRACLADLFIMREPVAGGRIAAVPGTEVYRAPNSFEAALVAIALDQLGLHREAADGYRVCLEMQEADGNWCDEQGWGHLMWGGSGFKAWAALEHSRLTGDRAYLAEVFPRLAASTRFQEAQRRRTRAPEGQPRPLTHGLMPPGFGDCGLKDGDDLYGTFLPHNVWAVYADRLAVEAAEILGRTEEAAALRRLYEAGRADLLAALDRGAVQGKEGRWIPGVPGKTSGSRWGALNALYPCRILPADHELVEGTFRQVEAGMSAGGLPLNTGWLADGLWVAIALDNLAEAHLARGHGDAAARLLYAALNHGTPLVTWCEERSPEPGASRCTGDRQHLWTPVAVVRTLRDGLVMEDGAALHLARGADRGWLATGRPLGVSGAATHFGPVSYEMRFDPATGRVTGEVTTTPGRIDACKELLVHVRLPGGRRLRSVDPASGATLLPDGETLRWPAPRGTLRFTAAAGPAGGGIDPGK